jgi:hypothetical protein
LRRKLLFAGVDGGDAGDINQLPGQRYIEGHSGFEQSIGEIAGDDSQ